jgi:hypothetical protein
MRRFLSWAAAAAIFAVPASIWPQQGDSTPPGQNQAQTSAQSGSTAPTAQSTSPQQDSLADAARKARESKKDVPKAAKVFDNDNMPSQGGISTVGTTKEAKEGQAGAADAAASPNGEKAWRDRFANLRAKLKRDQEDADVMQRELGVLNLQNYSDPVKAMQQELTRADINKKTADIDAKQKQVQADQQAIDDAEEELRKSGGDAGWAR